MKYRIVFWFILITYFLYCLYKFFATYIEFNAQLDKFESQLNQHEHIFLVNMDNLKGQGKIDGEKFIYKFLGISKNEILFIW